MLRKFLVIFILFTTFQSYAGQHKVIKVGLKYMGHGVIRSTYSIQVGNNILNQFKVKRVHKIGAPLFSRKPLIFLSPYSVDSREYEITESGDYRDTFLGNLAQHNVDVWAIDDRVNYQPAEGCTDGSLDCSVMAEWGFEQRASDTEFVRKLLKKRYRLIAPNIKLAIGGHTGGGMAAIAIVNAAPKNYSGLFSSGAAYTSDPVDQAWNLNHCLDLRARIDKGETIDSSLAKFTPIIDLLRTDPEGDSPYAPGLTNRQLFISIASAPGALGIFALSARHIFAQGDVASSTLKYLNLNAFYGHFYAIGTSASLNGAKQISCSGAGQETQHYNNLDKFSGPINFIGGPLGFGKHLEKTSLLFTNSSNIVVEQFPYDGGEVDYFLIDDNDRKKVYDQRVIEWMELMF